MVGVDEATPPNRLAYQEGFWYVMLDGGVYIQACVDICMAAGEDSLMFFELRQYRTKPGQREKWVKFMEEEIIPFQVSKGMVILGSFVGQEEDDLYVWIRRFESEAEREQLYKAVYESDHWKNYIAPQVPDMLVREQIKVTRLEATPKSVIQ